MYVWSHSTWDVDRKISLSESSWLYRKFKSGLGYKRPCGKEMKRKKVCAVSHYIFSYYYVCYTCVCKLAPWHACQLTTFRNWFSLPFRVPGIHLGPSGLPAKWHLDSLVVFIIYLGLFLPAIYSNYRFRNKEISANLSFQRIFSLSCKDTNPAVRISVVVALVCYAVYACTCTHVCGGQRLEVRGWHWICSVSLYLLKQSLSLNLAHWLSKTT